MVDPIFNAISIGRISQLAGSLLVKHYMIARLRRQSLLALCFAAQSLALSQAALADTTDCKNDKDTASFAQCITAALAKTREDLQVAFKQALESIPPLPLSDVQDSRKTGEMLKRHLIQAQSAWETYANETCSFVGGMQGRGLWIGIFGSECLIRESRARIDALRHLPKPP
jgi:uncharacterized protein YecT (DUF1311 family)